MRVAFIKHVLEPHGPWATLMADEVCPSGTLQLWPSKVTFLSPTVAWAADWYVVDCEIPWQSAHYGHIVGSQERIKLMRKYTAGVMAPDEVPVEDYDVVIALYPWVKPRGDALFTYTIQEHWDPLFLQSCARVMDGYDLHLDGMFSSRYELEEMPQSIGFPFPKFPQELRQVVGTVEKSGAAWIDGRVLLAMIDRKLWNEEEARTAAEDMARVLGIPLRYSGDFWREAFGLSDPPRWGDGLAYLRALAACKYYISMGRSWAPGEAICDAAALGCICIGDYRKLYHRLVCHPLCMVGDEQDLKAVAWQVFDSPSLQAEALAYQERMLRQHFQDRPMDVLAKALSMKGVTNE